MAITKITGNPEIDSILAQLHKHFGKDDLITIGPSTEAVTGIPTGSLALDVAIGCGGVPMGRIIEIFGPEASGKTSLVLKIASEYMKHRAEWGHEERRILIVDLEHTMTMDLIKGVGLDPSMILFSQPESAEEAFQTILDLAKSGYIGMIILDSVDAAQSASQLKKKMGEVQMAGVSKMMSELLRPLSKTCHDTNTTAIFINQIRMNPGVMMGSPVVTPGGNALKFYSSLRIRTLPNQKSTRIPNAMNMRVKIVKNKIRPPREDEIAFDFIYARGPDPALDLINTAKDLGIGYFGGQTFMVRFPGEETATRVATGGAAGAAAFLRANPEFAAKLRTRCIEAASEHTISTDQPEVVEELEEE